MNMPIDEAASNAKEDGAALVEHRGEPSQRVDVVTDALEISWKDTSGHRVIQFAVGKGKGDGSGRVDDNALSLAVNLSYAWRSSCMPSSRAMVPVAPVSKLPWGPG